MPASLPLPADEGRFNADLRGVHYDFIKDRLPGWFTQASARRQQELAAQPFQLPDWYANASPQARAQLDARHRQWRETSNAVEAQLGPIEDIAAFAEPLLKAAIKQQFNLEVDVRHVYFARKYAVKDRDDLFGAFVFDRSGNTLNDRYRGVSLLDAALANFEPGEEQPAPCNDCQIITAWSSYDDEVIPTFAVLAEHAVSITPHGFARLCRGLDLGAQYQAHLKQTLQPEDAAKRTTLEQLLEQQQRDALSLAASIATQQKAVSAEAAAMLQQLAGGQTHLQFDGRPVRLAALTVFGSVLVGPLLIGPERKGSERAERVLVYLPNDPRQPLKEYSSSGAFMADLRERLQSLDYRRFFSQFVPAREQGAFFRRFNALYPADDKAARLPLNASPLVGNLWEQRRLAQTRKIFADARVVAVPSGDEDRLAREQRLESYLDAVQSVLNLAAFVVPGLGQLMLTLGMAQVMGDIFEGIHAFEQRDLLEMWQHVAALALNVGAIATGAAVLPKVQWLSRLETLKPVTLPGGEQRLWDPDLSGYERRDWQPRTQPDAHGLYRDSDGTTLRLDGRYYQVTPDPLDDVYRIQHPQRADAYQPRVRHNGHGAWLHEADTPRAWSGAPLMRRLGPMMDGFSDAELQQIRHAGGIEEDRLRRVLADSAPTPALWQDSVRRFRAYADTLKLAAQLRAGTLSGELSWFAATLMTDLPGWPLDKAIEVSYGNKGEVVRYGKAKTTDSVLRISRDDLQLGQLPARVVESLSTEQLKDLLGQHLPPTPQARAQALNQRLVARAVQTRASTFASLYSERMPASDAAVRQVQKTFGSLPTALVQTLLADASTAELKSLTERQRVPLRMAEQARALQADLRLNRAYEGLYLPALAGADTEALVLGCLERLPGWRDAIRVEVRDGSFHGPLRAAFGAEDAPQRKVLVRLADAQYQAFDQQGQALHGINGFYGALQHALPDAHRQAIGLPHVGQGEQLKMLISDKALSRDALRGVLRMQPAQRPNWRWPQRISDNRVGYPLSGRGPGRRATLTARVQELYPTMSAGQVRQEVLTIEAGGGASFMAQEAEFGALDNLLNRWLGSGPRDPQALFLRRRIRDEIRQAWQRAGDSDIDTDGQFQGERIHLSDPRVGAHLATLPPLAANFDHVSSLHLPECGLTDQSNGFLSNFRRLRILNLEDNHLTRLPDVCAELRRVEGLELSGNQIVLTEQAALQIRHMHRLTWLALDRNPLGRGVDFSRMPNLHWVYMAGCGLNEWPMGLFASPRPRDFVLELSGNRLTSIPDVAPGSERARLLARAAVSEGWLTQEVLDALKLYRESIGMDPVRRAPPRRSLDSARWMAGLTREQWTEKQSMWNDVEETPGSEGFFDELRKLSLYLPSRSEAYKVDFTTKVWRMIEAMAASTQLRERLFQMAAAPTTCVDAGAQIFNTMGVEVLLHEALALTDPNVLRLELLDLAKGKARLDELARIGHARVNELIASGRTFPTYDEEGALIQRTDADGNPIVNIDEVEIHMAYTSRLAQRLDLPWQTGMHFTEPDVTPAMIDAAHTRVLALEQGDLLRDGVMAQLFWRDYVRATFFSEFHAVSAKNEALLDYVSAQEEWAGDGGLAVEQKAALRTTIETSAQVMGKPAAEVVLGQVMGEAEYQAATTRLGEEHDTVMRAVTDRIMGRV